MDLLSTRGTDGGDMVLFLDSDAFWRESAVTFDQLLHQYVPAPDWAARGRDAASIFFGCNLPYKSEDRGKRRWNSSLINAERGPPNTGVMVLRNTASVRDQLRTWWATAATTPQWNFKHAWEQSALWHLWARQPEFARGVRVLHDEQRNACMRTMDPHFWSPIVHVALGQGSSAKQNERREAMLEEMGLRQNVSRSWATCLTQLPMAPRSADHGADRQALPNPGASELTSRCGSSQLLEVSAEGIVQLRACDRACEL